ncbi:hypothetical protein A5731_28820 [Mycolicibacterium conceptionense]|uniref:Uncharacterized protein n=1 Tax=Mycolicibacterium conceptionense TaxID=451644 RepID=A0A1A0PUF4_9MYCO|nr:MULTISPECIES: proline-rich domain-containing protein [Mycolicibacterium]MCW1825076.1 hypothetical protein [Mycolicibacterium senegalense]OBB13323.1 hypothetical protein A5718_02945 [Mycolicibacterium conceptionense]OBE92717.1 hypothetical protein A5731_28820 [Mycolicibacterium conceptionense]OBF12082.1 hypothetical protein A5726_29465 [Mycolicibacterium conceptionense]OBF43198.1 hypothetical protein A5720_13220 [Mycolicibacterium conceptionense]
MTLPPPPGPYGAQPSGGGEPQWVGPPLQGPGAPPPFGQPGPWPPQQWGAPPPSNNGGKAKWILGGIAVTLAIALAVVITVLVVRPAGGDRQQSDTANGASEFASANDTRPANIITEDPTCEAWGRISDGMEAASPGWNDQDYSIPETDWTPEQRAIFEKKRLALTEAIPGVTSIAKQTPHRAMREIYDQYIAYSRTVIDSIPTYSTKDNYAVGVSNQLAGSLNRICDSIYFRAAQQTAPLIPSSAPPSDHQPANSDMNSEPERFLKVQDGACKDWVALAERFDKDSEPWRQISAKIPATEWSADQRTVMEAIVPVMTTYANNMEKLGRKSRNLVWEDFAVMAAQYMRAYVSGIPTYTVNIGYLSSASSAISNSVYWACKAAS